MTTAPLSLHYLIRPSSLQNAKPPAIFLFHGYGSNEEDLFSFAPELPEELCVISVRAPYPAPPFGFAWYAINFNADFGKWSDVTQAKSSIKKIVTFIKEAIEVYDLDASSLTLLGFSQGTVLSLAVALSYPNLIRNVVALSGYIDENTLTPDYKENDHSHLKIYVSHGQVDPVIPLSWAQRTPPLLDKLGIDYAFEEYPTGHGVSQQNFYSLRTWLKDKI